VTGLTTGEHTLTLTATDPDGASGSASLVLAVLPNQPPAVRFLSPSSQSLVLAGDPIQVVAELTDDEPTDALALAWGGVAADSAGAPTTPDSDGRASLLLAPLAPGEHSVQLTATDAHGASATGELTLTITDDDVDDDGVRALAFGGTDCDDGDSAVFPGAPERCNGVDDDCDGQVDEGSVNTTTFYVDADGDGFGGTTAVQACALPPGASAVSGDCADGDPDVHPGAAERCNGADDDCNGGLPSSETTDADHDGSVACADCDDADANVYPGATERCDGLDDDCDGSIPTAETADADHDGSVTCADCDDADATSFPGAAELCDGVDNDCNGALPANETTDADHDGAMLCEDCDDTSPDASPLLTERCDALDNNCDGLVDEDACTGCAWEEQVATGGGVHTYQLCAGPLDWHAARTACLAMGYDLASIADRPEQTWLFSAVSAAGSGPWWLGGADELVEGSWGWADGSAWSFTSWEPSQPDNGFGGEDCLELGRFPSGNWNDTACANTQAYACELWP